MTPQHPEHDPLQHREHHPEDRFGLRVDPTTLREAAHHFSRRPSPPAMGRLDPAAVGDPATAAAAQAFTSAYHAAATALTTDDAAATAHLLDTADQYLVPDTFRIRHLTTPTP
jgi:hypothetical protein